MFTVLRRTAWFSLLTSVLVVSSFGHSGVLAQDGSESEPAAAVQPAPGEAGETPDPAPTWMEQSDYYFGTYVVGPMAAVLFFDFGTGKWLGTSIPFVVAWLFVGAIFFTFRMGFINIRGFWHAIRLTKGDYDEDGHTGEVSHFQALSSALSATVGLGNIAGVAIAIGTGGPGATFWMILVGLLGMSSKFAECTLGQMYRKVEPDGTVSGGPMRYLRDGLAELNLGPLGVILATVFAVICAGASFGGGNAFQVSQSLSAIRTEIPILDTYPWIYGLGMAVMVGIVIIGGIRSIGAVAGRIVPFMCGAYVLAAMYIIITNYDRVVPSVQLILQGAFTPGAAYGGFIGVLVVGIQRAVFSNEAGVGSAAIAHSAARTDEPVSEGIVALLEPFIDTVIVCTMTALVIVITGSYESRPTIDSAEAIATTRDAIESQLEADGTIVSATAWLAQEGTQDAWGTPLRLTSTDSGPASFAVESAGLDKKFDTADDISSQDEELLLRSDLIRQEDGAALTATAFAKGGYSWFRWILFAAVVLFAYSTLISWSYYGERCWVQLFGTRSSMVYKVLFMGFAVVGSVVTARNVRTFSDLLILGLAFPNILGVALLSGKVRRALDEYWVKYKSGKLDPRKD